MKIGKMWQWLLAASGVLGSLFVIVDQAERIKGWVGDATGGGSAWVASIYYGFESVQRSTAAELAEAFHANKVCVGSVTTADLDGDGYATDLIAKFVDLGSLAESDPPLSCEDYAREGDPALSQHERFLVAKGEGLSHRVLASLAGFNGVEAMGGLVVGGYFETDFPTSTIFGYQSGKLVEIRQFDHMLEYGTGDDEEIEVFDLIATGKGVRVRAADGLSDIQWDDQSQAYVLTHLDWTAAIANNQYVLYVQPGPAGAESEAAVMINGEKLAGADSVGQTVTTSVRTLDRIVFDPHCLVQEGFKDIPNALGAVALDPAAPTHAFDCVLYPGAVVTVRVEAY